MCRKLFTRSTFAHGWSQRLHNYRVNFLPFLPFKIMCPLSQLCLLYLSAVVVVGVSGQDGDNGNDSACLSGFRAKVQDNARQLTSWSTTQLAIPCNESISPLNGVTCDNNRVFSLALRGLSLSGTISSSISKCSALNTLDLSGNQFSGGIPIQLDKLANLVSLNLSGNQLSGIIPSQLSNCSYLNILDLHSNQLVGFIPAELGTLSRLIAFDVSDNQLSGEIPSVLSYSLGGAPRFNDTSFTGNKDLYGFPLLTPSGRSLSVLKIAMIGLASGLLSLILSFTAVCIWLRYSEQRLAATEGKISDLVSEP